MQRSDPRSACEADKHGRQLEPLVFLGTKKDHGVQERPRTQGYPGAEKMKAGGGLDAELYETLRSDIWDRRILSDASQSSLMSNKTGRKA